MHNCFLGLWLVSCGNIIWELFNLFHFSVGTFPLHQRLHFMFLSLQAYARRHRLHLDLSTFTLASLGHPSDTVHPELHCKGHDVRVIIGWLAEECARACDVHTPTGKCRLAVARSQLELCLAVEQAPRYLTNPDHLARIQTAGYNFLDLYTALAERCREADVPRWKLLRKTHLLIHLLEDAGRDLQNVSFFRVGRTSRS